MPKEGLLSLIKEIDAKLTKQINIYAVGGNKDAAYASGINTDLVTITAFIICGTLAALAGWVLSARYASVAPGMGEGMIFDVVAAAVIGGVSLQGGEGDMKGLVGGVLLLAIISNVLNLLKLSPFYIQIVRGVVIFLAVLIDSIKYRITAN